MSICISFFALEFLTNIINSISDMEFKFYRLVPMAIIIFGYILMTGIFKSECSKSKNYFEELFVAKITK
jgi:undecaprenyl pyrophosphate phosphatase UppP